MLLAFITMRLFLPKPSFHERDLINRGSLKFKLPTGKITAEKNISSSAFQEKINQNPTCLPREHKLLPTRNDIPTPALWGSPTHVDPHMCKPHIHFLSKTHLKSSWFCGSLSQLQTFLTGQMCTACTTQSWHPVQAEVEVSTENTERQKIMIKLRYSSSTLAGHKPEVF